MSLLMEMKVLTTESSGVTAEVSQVKSENRFCQCPKGPTRFSKPSVLHTRSCGVGVIALLSLIR
jgi:hypothetical protein